FPYTTLFRSVVDGPYSGGQSHQRQPLLSTCTIPLMTRRSSTRSTPRTSVGKCGSIRIHCSSLSQNRFARMIPIPLLKRIRIVWNQDCVASAQKLMSFDRRAETPKQRRGILQASHDGQPVVKP